MAWLREPYDGFDFANVPGNISRFLRDSYGMLRPLAQDPYAGAAIGAVPVLGDFARGMEQASQMNKYMEDYGINSTDVTYPVSSYSQFLPAIQSMIYGGINQMQAISRGRSRRRSSWRRKAYRMIHRDTVRSSRRRYRR